jgi:hypothetical protein
MMKVNLQKDGVALSDDQICQLNELVSFFYGAPLKVVNVELVHEGQNQAPKNHYVLILNNNRKLSVKRAYMGKPEHTQRELFIAEMRQKFNIPHYKVELQKGFPFPDWEEQECLLIDWGINDRRPHIQKTDDVKRSINNNKQLFIEQMANVAALTYLFAISDRKNEHMVWDLDSNELFSIDHELSAGTDCDPIDYFKNLAIKCHFGEKWYDDINDRKVFSDTFKRIWEIAESCKQEILQTYDRLGLVSDKSKFDTRLAKGSQWVLQQIFS